LANQIGLIGYGRFGKLAARFIAQYANVLVFDKQKEYGRFPSRRIRAASLAEAAAQPVVILAVPISSLQQTLLSIAPFLQPQALIVDACSVKVKPVQWMKQLLPKHVYILGAHSLFGPDSVSQSLRGRTVVICPVRISCRLLAAVKRLLRARGLRVVLMTPHKHDRMMAETILLTQYIGRLVGSAGLKRWADSTPHYSMLMSLVDVAQRDSMQLFRDMWRYNPYSIDLKRALARAASVLRRELK
jgi:prephenate dehydrogenase